MSEIRDFWDIQKISSVPYTTGSILMIPYTISDINTLFPGFVYCDGSTFSTLGIYINLFNKIGYRYGGSGSSFRVPDYRGMFLRGRDDGGGVDPNISQRTNNSSSTGTNVGSEQSQQIERHRHWTQYDNNTTGNLGWADDNAQRYQWVNTSVTGSVETRPRNRSMVFIIKY